MSYLYIFIHQIGNDIKYVEGLAASRSQITWLKYLVRMLPLFQNI